jgi:hypothetical protein
MLMGHFQRKNVKRVRTLVAWYEGDLLSYFKSLGFDILNMIPLERMIPLPSPGGDKGRR